MKLDEIIQMAHKANFEGFGNGDWVCTTDEIQHFAQLVAAHEREACAKLVDSWESEEGEHADAIRARVNK